MGELAQRLGAEVRARRKARGLTQAQLAERTDLSEEWVRRIERAEGSPSLDTVEAICGALGATPGEMFAGFDVREARLQKLMRLANGLTDREIAWLEEAAALAVGRPSRR